jgi:Lon protease-like protein
VSELTDDTLPLFPLNTVLLPGVALPLHIFEERYRTMISRCLAESGRFGVVLIAEGNEVGAPAVPYQVGTTAHIVGVDRLEDGRMNIVCVGEDRFRILEMVPGAPYLQARVALWPDTEEQCDAEALAAEVRASLAEVLGKTVAQSGEQLDALQRDPAALAHLLAAGLPVDAAERQRLLELPGTCSRLGRILTLLHNEALMLRSVGGARYVAERPSRFSMN